MKILLLSFSFSLLFFFGGAQITTQQIKANFGVDGELRTNFFNNFSWSGNDDWFLHPSNAGSGKLVIDTTGAAAIVAGYSTDVSPWPKRSASLYRQMSVAPYTIVNHKMWLDAMFIRDYHGDDTTVFSMGSKNGMSPADWNCPVSQSIPDKNDILDMFMHVRRAGETSTDSLWMFGGLSLDNVTGNRFFDFEMYQTDIYYDRASLKWYGYGPDAGHTKWEFDAAGNVTKPGDIIFSASYQSSTLTTIEARIWIDKNSLSTTPTNFSWSGSFDGATTGSQYGYASIMPNTSGAFYTGLGSSNNSWAGPFLTVLQNNVTATNYVKDQFMEFSVNLTKLGLDPVYLLGGDICGTPFNRLVVKTRASESFSAGLKDFVAPTDLFLAPRVNVQADVPLFCGAMGVSNIQVLNPSSSSVYTWTTPNGHIVGSTSGTNITVDTPGTYLVTQQLSAGCKPYAYDTTAIVYDANCTVLQDSYIDLGASLNNNNIPVINWMSYINKKVRFYQLEVSHDGTSFTTVKRIENINNAFDIQAYKYQDVVVPKGPVYYRIKVVTNTSGFYSRIVKIYAGNNLNLVLSPNPAVDHVKLSLFAEQSQKVQVAIFDFAGKTVYNHGFFAAVGENVLTINEVQNWSSGMYMAVVKMGDKTQSQKIIVGNYHK